MSAESVPTSAAVARSPVVVAGDRANRANRAAALALMAVSGFAGLGYQVVWTQQGSLWLGHEAAALLAVVGAFFGGLAVGALAFGPAIERSPRPLRWYAACELVIATWAGVLAFAMPAIGDALLAITGPSPGPAWQWSVAFVGMFVLLLPATCAMGATLPAIERVVSGLRDAGRSIAGLYAANTFGAMAGVLATAFWLVPRLGLTRTAIVCIAMNLMCAAAAPLLLASDASRAASHSAPSVAPGRRRGVLVRLFLTGLLGIGQEVLVVRALSELCEDTVYTFAMLLAVYLAGSASGAAAYHLRLGSGDGRHPRTADDDDRVTDRLIAALVGAGLVACGVLWSAAALKTALVAAFGDGLAAALAAEAALALAVFALPTFVMGALFSHLAAVANRNGIAFGRAIGTNIVGAALAPWLFGVMLVPRVGLALSVLVVVAGNLALLTRRAWKRPIAWTAAAGSAALAFHAPPLAFVDVPDGGRVVQYRDGVTAAVGIVEEADGVLTLRIDNRQQEGSSATGLVDGRQAMLPLLLHPAPARALFLGVGTGITAATAAEDPTVDVDAVELLPEVIAASPVFTVALNDGVPNPRLHLLNADARRYVRTATRRYDVIVADNFHPARGGSGALYTVEHFAAVKERLADGGLFCQWLPLHQLDLDTLRSIVRSFVAVYPGARAMLASNSLGTPVLGLVGDRDGRRFDPAAIDARLARARSPRPPAAFGIDDAYALLGSFVAGPTALARFAAAADLNTDNRPIVAYRAPHATYAPRSTADARLIEFLQQVAIAPGDVVDGTVAPAAADRLAAYWRARDRFLVAGRGVRPSGDVRTMLAQIGEPLLDVLRTSPDFRPAYDPLLRMATALATRDADAATRLLVALDRIQPARPEAAVALKQLGAR